MRRFRLAAVFACLFAGLLHSADDQDVCRQLLDKTMKASGGADKFAKLGLATWKSKGKLSIENVEMTLSDDWYVKADDKFRVDVNAEINGQTIRGIVVVNGDKAWTKANDGKTNDLPKEVVTGLKEGLHGFRVIHRLSALKDKPYELSPLGEVKIDNREAIGIRIIQKGRNDLSLFLDKKTHLPIKCEVRVAESNAEVSYEFFYDEYKDFDGLKHCSKIVFKRDGKQFLETEITEVKPQDQLDDTLFDKP